LAGGEGRRDPRRNTPATIEKAKKEKRVKGSRMERWGMCYGQLLDNRGKKLIKKKKKKGKGKREGTWLQVSQRRLGGE